MTGKLSRLQVELLHGFFRRENRFFLTGGGALAGYHLGHRSTQDLDLFVTSPHLEEGEAALEDTAREIGATLESVRTAPDFRRRLVRRSDDSVIVDLVLDRAPQGYAEKQRHGVVRVDPPEEILANKLCTLLSRAEIRDLVDVLFLEKAGFRVEAALALAEKKDGGLTPGQLAWVLSGIQIGDDADVAGGLTARELRGFVADLESRLARLAFPEGHP